MSFRENLKVEIESIFNSAGFEKLQAQLKETQAQMSATFGQVKKMRNMRREASKFSSVMERAGLAEREKGDAPFSNLASGEGRRGSPVGAEKGMQRMMRAMAEMEMMSAGLSQNVSNVNSHMQKAADAAVNALGGVESEGFADTLSTRRFQETTHSTNRLGGAFRRASVGAMRLGARVKGLAGSLASAAPAARQLQMQLLGLQFTMLTVAFIFGGLAMGALGAVGAFKVLGNALRFFFLPSALNVLDVMLDFQSAIMGMDRTTREQIGNMFMLAAGFAVVVGILAALGKAVLSVVGFFLTLGSVAGTIVSALTGISTSASGLIGTLTTIGGGSLLTGIKVAFGLAKQTIMGLLGTLASAASFLAGFAGGFLVVIRAAKRFGKKVAFWVGTILAVLAGVGAAIASTLGAPFVLVAGLIGLALGAIAGLIWTFKDTIIRVFATLAKGVLKYISALGTALMKAFNFIVNGIVSILGWLVKKVIGNSIIPDMVNDIVSFIMSIPSKIVNLGSNIVDTIVNGIKKAGSSIWDAFKKILPEFLVDAIEGAGGAIKGIAKAGGEIVGAAGETIGKVGEGFNNAVEGVKNFTGDAISGAQNFASDVGDTVFGGGDGGNNGGGKTNVQQNNINVEAEVNNSEETAQETGTQLGQGMNNELERRWGQKNP